MRTKLSAILVAIASTCAASSDSKSNLSAGDIARRAVEAALWGLPMVRTDAMRQAFFRDAGAKYGDVLYLSRLPDWKFQIETPDPSSLYVYLNFNLKDGPFILEIPVAAGAGLAGSINDAWQTPLAGIGPAGEDQGQGGKFLLLPPDDQGTPPKAWIPVSSPTYNGYALIRAIPVGSSPGDIARAIDLVMRIRLYPLGQADSPPPSRHIDISGRIFDGTVRFDDTFYDSLARMVNEEPVRGRDLAAMNRLRSLGMEKDKVFQPGPAARAILKKAIAEAHESFMAGSNGNSRDACGEPLRGERAYCLRIPAAVAAKPSWEAAVYDRGTGSFIRDSPRIAVNSAGNVQRNADGSIDIYFGPAPPRGRESNWIYTAPGKRWFAVFRRGDPESTIPETARLPGAIEPLAH